MKEESKVWKCVKKVLFCEHDKTQSECPFLVFFANAQNCCLSWIHVFRTSPTIGKVESPNSHFTNH